MRRRFRETYGATCPREGHYSRAYRKFVSAGYAELGYPDSAAGLVEGNGSADASIADHKIAECWQARLEQYNSAAVVQDDYPSWPKRQQTSQELMSLLRSPFPRRFRWCF
eukprot:6918597-Alexandrium_andersonii.AAC.1